MSSSQIERIAGTERFREVRASLAESDGPTQIAGVSDSRAAWMVGLLAETAGEPCLVLTPTWHSARRLADDLRFLTDRPVFLMPEPDDPGFLYSARSREDLTARLSGLTALARRLPAIVLAAFAEAAEPLPPPAVFLRDHVHLAEGMRISPEELRERLQRMGYERLETVEAPGQYGSRGELLDIFPPDCGEPIRVEFFDVEIDALRRFDPVTQRSIGRITQWDVYPAGTLLPDSILLEGGLARIKAAYLGNTTGLSGEALENRRSIWQHIAESAETGLNLQLLSRYNAWFYEQPARLWDYLPEAGILVIDDPTRISRQVQNRYEEAAEWIAARLETGQAVAEEAERLICPCYFFGLQKRRRSWYLTPFRDLPDEIAVNRVIPVESAQTPVFNGRMDFLETELKRYDREGFDLTLVSATADRAANLEEFIRRIGLTRTPHVCKGSLNEGILFPEEKFLILPDRDIFLTGKRRKKRRAEATHRPLSSFIDLRPGDYIVHENQGIGCFSGTVQMEVQGVRRDYLRLEYAGNDVLYVPVEQMDLVQKYASADSVAPRLSRMGGSEWKRTRDRAKIAIRDMTKELLDLSAARQLEPGYAFAEDSVWQSEFEEQFPYEETPDQLRSTREIKRDMERPEAMDRLLCGDVGYGKTEVAMRAIFKCVTEGRQAAVLVPTTLLANQHQRTFAVRFSGFPIRVEMLSRFRTAAQQAGILRRLRTGEVDILIGTHRLLSRDVAFKDLGLLVIDEEQHFGVRHKEAIKQLRKNVDVLTLSATPIPRTLHMSLAGIRDISLIEEPPEERYPVRTYVMEQDERVVREAINRELDRGGQVYVIYNRVKGIRQVAEHIRRLVPQASVAVAHGQMAEEQLEKIMLEFEENQHQVLVSTTIVESGLDIPNVNTMIILNADRFGLSQLYQLRGRVGRSNRPAYAYLMYQKQKELSEVAEKRLRAIREFTEFGAGFRIAMRDLEIRGAGNLLGSEQHGHMMTIGYELYCRLVDEAVRELGGESVPVSAAETSVDLDVAGYIPDEYIADELQRLQMYKRIASIQSEDDRLDVVDEMLDRYGDLPDETLNLTRIALIRALAGRAGISEVSRQQQHLILTLDPQRAVDPMRLAGLSAEYGRRLLIHGGQRPYVRLYLQNENENEKPLRAALGILTKMTE